MVDMSSDHNIINRELTWNVDGLPMKGTLTMPDDDTMHPGVILIAGSGPTDRDWCSPLLPGTNGSGKLLAEYLALRGFSTFRYDKIASAKNVKDYIKEIEGKISMQSHVEELAGAVSAFILSGATPKTNLIALTNSEGSIHALNYQFSGRKPGFSGFIMTGVAARTIGDVARSQILFQTRMLENHASIMRSYDESISAFLAGSEATPDPSLPEGVKTLIMGLSNPVNLPFSRELWNYSMASAVQRVKEPVLMIIGKKDIQVNWKDDGGIIERIAEGHKNITVYFPENANHVLKYEDRAAEQLSGAAVAESYNSDRRIIDPDTVNRIYEWLLANSE